MAAAYTAKFRVNNISEGSPGYGHVNLVEHDIDPTRGRSTGAVVIAVPLEDTVNYAIGAIYTVSLTEVSA
jgi:hypothetical protein